MEVIKRCCESVKSNENTALKLFINACWNIHTLREYAQEAISFKRKVWPAINQLSNRKADELPIKLFEAVGQDPSVSMNMK